MKFILLSVLFLFVNAYNFAQQHQCGTDEMHQQLFLNNVGLHQKIIESSQKLEHFTQYFTQNYNPQSKGNIAYTIPVVIHVVHNNGVENVSNAQLLDGMKILNEGFQKRNPDTADLVAPFKQLAVDCEIEFKLAQLDPDGNCTSGITRYIDSSTYSGLHNVKDIVQWDPSKYLNIYVCNQAAGLAGHAMMPAPADTIPEWDGIVMAHTAMGSIGTGNVLRARVIVHEVAHYLNLQHIWGGNNVPNYPYLPVADPGNCAFDDGVTDTPNTIGHQTQSLTGSSCGSDDNMQNFMEYTYLNSMFTQGQKVRMHAALNSPIANRNNLWTNANLIATGVINNDEICKLDFEVDKRYVCAGETINFTSISSQNVNSWSWTFDGGSITNSSDSIVAVLFNNPGVYDVKLIASNGINADSVIKTSFIEVFESPSDRNGLVEDFEHLIQLEDSHWFTDEISDTWEVSTSVGKNSNKSIRLSNFDDFSGRKTYLYSKPIDASNANSMVLSFDYAFAKKEPINNDQLRVAVSKDCGASWLTRKTIPSSAIATVSNSVNVPFTPTIDEWENIIITNINSSYFTGELMVRFEFTAGGGNDIYIDNINLYDPVQVGIEEEYKLSMYIYPNPSNGFVYIEFNEIQINPTISIYDIAGKLVQESEFNGEFSSVELITNNLVKGTYFLSVNHNKTELLIVK